MSEKKEEIKLLGTFGIDSAKLMICDPAYIDEHWKKEDYDFTSYKKYQHRTSGEILEFGEDFRNYEEVLPQFNMTMNQLLKTGEWELLPGDPAKNPFSYNAACKAVDNNPNRAGELHFSHGNSGAAVVVSTGSDGGYKVYGLYDEDGVLIQLIIPV
jgi:hypothetical protein